MGDGYWRAQTYLGEWGESEAPAVGMDSRGRMWVMAVSLKSKPDAAEDSVDLCSSPVSSLHRHGRQLWVKKG